MNDLFIIIIQLLEAGIVITGGFAFFRKKGATFSESVSYAIIILLMALSFTFQLSFIAGIPWISFFLEAALCFCSLWFLFIFRNTIIESFFAFRSFTRERPVFALFFILGLFFLFIPAIFGPPPVSTWDELAEVLWLQKQHYLFTPEPNPFLSGLPPMNTRILTHFFLRWHTEVGQGLLSFIAFLSIGFSTYALSRRYSWPFTAFTVVLVVVSMPRVTWNATTPGFEIIPAAVALFVLLLITRLVEQPNILDLIFLINAVPFTVTDGIPGLVLPVLLTILSGLILFRRHGIRSWGNLIFQNSGKLIPFLIPAAVFSQCIVFFYNAHTFGEWMTKTGEFAINNGGIQGGIANFGRFFFESANFPPFIDHLCKYMFGFSPVLTLQSLFDSTFGSLFGEAGTIIPFKISWMVRGDGLWFGPFVFLFILPAIFFAFFRGSRRLKAFATALIGYLYIMTLIVAWEPGIAKLFTVFYVCGGVSVAFLLPPWRISRNMRRGVQALCMMLLFYTCLFSLTKPTIDQNAFRIHLRSNRSSLGKAFREAIKGGILSRIIKQWERPEIRLRFSPAASIPAFLQETPKNSVVGLIAHDPASLYPCFLLRPDIRFIIMDNAEQKKKVSGQLGPFELSSISVFEHGEIP